jgi:hypothetical protein
MDKFSVHGKVRTNHNKPAEGYSVHAYDRDYPLNPDDFLGEKSVDSNGFFRIDFDRSKFAPIYEFAEGSPDVYLRIKVEEGKKEVLMTKETKTNKEIEYQIRIAEHIADPNAPDIYAGNARRLLNMLNEVGDLIGLERRINLRRLNNQEIAKEIRKNLEGFARLDDERRRNFEHVLVILSSFFDSYLEELKIGTIGYDGPQVPRHPRRQEYNQEIIWPRQEKFKWE